MIKAIVYDLDGMIVLEPHYFSIEASKRYGIPAAMFDFGEVYQECKIGKIAVKEMLLPIYKRLKEFKSFTLTLDQYIKEWFNFATLNDELIKIAKDLQKKGIVNIIFTNNSRERVEYLDKKFNLSKTFAIVGSYQLGVLKPDPKFYEILQKKHKLEPKEVLIFDDKVEKIYKILPLGYHAEVYSNVLRFRDSLKNFKVI